MPPRREILFGESFSAIRRKNLPVMCIVFWHLAGAPDDPDVLASEYRWIVASNRDEFLSRATIPAGRWGRSGAFAGRDAVGGGTWLGEGA